MLQSELRLREVGSIPWPGTWTVTEHFSQSLAALSSASVVLLLALCWALPVGSSGKEMQILYGCPDRALHRQEKAAERPTCHHSLRLLIKYLKKEIKWHTWLWWGWFLRRVGTLGQLSYKATFSSRFAFLICKENFFFSERFFSNILGYQWDLVLITTKKIFSKIFFFFCFALWKQFFWTNCEFLTAFDDGKNPVMFSIDDISFINFCFPWLQKREPQGELRAAFQYLKGLRESWRGTFCKCLEWQDKGEWL